MTIFGVEIATKQKDWRQLKPASHDYSYDPECNRHEYALRRHLSGLLNVPNREVSRPGRLLRGRDTKSAGGAENGQSLTSTSTRSDHACNADGWLLGFSALRGDVIGRRRTGSGHVALAFYRAGLRSRHETVFKRAACLVRGSIGGRREGRQEREQPASGLASSSW